ncbi:hypothetical protein DIPPA_25879 [Diplonema papillatum]|nr:hypothetical protein DIPPA_25879 [Diplonema papillatum]
MSKKRKLEQPQANGCDAAANGPAYQALCERLEVLASAGVISDEEAAATKKAMEVGCQPLQGLLHALDAAAACGALDETRRDAAEKDIRARHKQACSVLGTTIVNRRPQLPFPSPKRAPEAPPQHGDWQLFEAENEVMHLEMPHPLVGANSKFHVQLETQPDPDDPPDTVLERLDRAIALTQSTQRNEFNGHAIHTKAERKPEKAKPRKIPKKLPPLPPGEAVIDKTALTTPPLCFFSRDDGADAFMDEIFDLPHGGTGAEADAAGGSAIGVVAPPASAVRRPPLFVMLPPAEVTESGQRTWEEVKAERQAQPQAPA